MSAPAPVIYHDSMFESEFTSPANVVSKLETIDQLSCHLPASSRSCPSGSLLVDSNESPILVHTDVLDSVFSTNLDDNDNFLNDTPMFDELDFIMDGNKVNSKDDWVSLFKDEVAVHTAPSPNKEEDLGDLFADDFKETFEFVPATKTSKQLETPVTPAILTPVISQEILPSSSKNRVSKKKVDHLGCVSYSKKSRAQPLRPVEMDSEDPLSLKRARNTEAARRSRARKMERMSQLECKVEELLESKQALADEVLRLKDILAAHDIAF